MFGSIRKLMSNMMPKRPSLPPSPARPTGWSDRSGFSPSVRASKGPNLNPPPAGAAARPASAHAQALEGKNSVDGTAERPFEEVVQLVSEWLKEKAYTAAEALEVWHLESPATERGQEIARELKSFQTLHELSDREMLGALSYVDARRHTNDGDPAMNRVTW